MSARGVHAGRRPAPHGRPSTGICRLRHPLPAGTTRIRDRSRHRSTPRQGQRNPALSSHLASYPRSGRGACAPPAAPVPSRLMAYRYPAKNVNASAFMSPVEMNAPSIPRKAQAMAYTYQSR